LLTRFASLAHLVLTAAALSLAAPAGAQPAYDLLLKGGRVIDPANGVNGERDVAIADGRIAAVEPQIGASQARQVFDVSGLYVTPGLVDLHTHLFWNTGIRSAWAGTASVRPDDFSFRNCTTTMVDAGSAGWRNFESFRYSVIDVAKTRVFALINIAGYGMISNLAEQGDFDPEAVAKLAEEHSGVVVGVKTAHYEKPDWTSVEKAVEAGEMAGIPVMVDFGHFLPERPYWRLVTEKLRPGDISTHCFRSAVPWINSEGEIYNYLHEARERGVKFDVGHGGGSFLFRNAAPAVKAGFYPDSISTDLHTSSMNAAMMDLPTLLAKFLAMGMPWEEVVRAATVNPAAQMGNSELGRLSVGAPADVAVMRIGEGEFGFRDVAGGRLEGDRRPFCEMTLLEGEVVWDWDSRTGTDYEELPPDYGTRDADHLVLPPE